MVGVHPAVAAEPTKGSRQCEEDVATGPIMGRTESKGVRAVTEARGVTRVDGRAAEWACTMQNVSNFGWSRSVKKYREIWTKRDDKLNLERGMYVVGCFHCLCGVYRHCDGDLVSGVIV